MTEARNQKHNFNLEKTPLDFGGLVHPLVDYPPPYSMPKERASKLLSKWMTDSRESSCHPLYQNIDYYQS